MTGSARYGTLAKVGIDENIPNEDETTVVKTFNQLMREGTPEEISEALPPSGRYISKKLRAAVYERDQYACFFCGKRQDDGADLTLDHFIARALGGPNTFDNLFTACRSCNSRKGKLGPGFIARRMALGIRKFGV